MFVCYLVQSYYSWGNLDGGYEDVAWFTSKEEAEKLVEVSKGNYSISTRLIKVWESYEEYSRPKTPREVALSKLRTGGTWSTVSSGLSYRRFPTPCEVQGASNRVGASEI